MKNLFLFFFLDLFLVFCFANEPEIKADTIFFGGTIFTLQEGEIDPPETLAIAEDKIIFVGSKKDALYLQKESTNWINLDQGALLPGFITTSCNLLFTGLNPYCLDLSSLRYKSLKHVNEALKLAAKNGPVLAYGFSSSLLKKSGSLTLKSLDAISQEVPILVIDKSAMMGYANKKCLSEAGITTEMALSMQGDFRIKKNGKLSGEVISLKGLSMLLYPFEKSLHLDFKTLCEKGAKNFIAKGYTTVCDTSSPLLIPDAKAHFEMLEKASKVTGLNIKGFYDPTFFDKEGKPIFPSSPFLEILGIHFILDGPIQIPYSIKTEYTKSAIIDKANLVRQNGLIISFKASSPLAIKEALDCIAMLQRLRYSLPRDFIIQDASLADNNLLEKIDFFHTGLSFSMDEIYLYGDALKKILGKALLQQLILLQSANALNIPFVLTQPSSTRSPNPLLLLETAITRETFKKTIINRKERLNCDQAIKAITLYPAMTIKKEGEIGSLEVGKKADLVILNKSPKQVPANKISQIKILSTWIGGKKIEWQQGD